MKILTLQEMTEAQKTRVKTKLNQERKKWGRALTNAEYGRVKSEIIAKISNEVQLTVKKNYAQKKKNKITLDNSTYSWSFNNHSKGLR
ncbi:hypothetical protein GFV14_00765 [Candidatus Hartigia pinicola]|nr:hypothetical protein GFV14_00765 [Candidatus Hartigia pinicola]